MKVVELGKFEHGLATLYIRSMPEFFNFDINDMMFVPVWVIIRNISAELYNKKALSKIAQKIGKPVQMDKVTSEMGRLGFARLQVEVDASKPLRRSLTLINAKGKSYEAPIEYSYEPVFCSKCQTLTHKTDQCRAEAVVKRGRSRKPKPVVSAAQDLPVTAVWAGKRTVLVEDPEPETGDKAVGAVVIVSAEDDESEDGSTECYAADDDDRGSLVEFNALHSPKSQGTAPKSKFTIKKKNLPPTAILLPKDVDLEEEVESKSVRVESEDAEPRGGQKPPKAK
ncbi:PREDICTED: uncharacterized protein LOC105976781 [Erythranthe guttata]|uniref:uncharacterized protein LOC105962851 n=1 Tax=Erythranthe guttata TaxID=4155 RepID=UPI00064DAC46|nr:PREDICTED: uncharacterized protein LOC105962851 [Erythranthe guttata]XP_012843501.1 PREDICTED: uncharacterized protein LOC105963631 [Erythranthe guttata]XP_012857499.1 PREDICTED: uncharacterized protein LOC105976781 [Erythranthe guttata]|eukprot:XP_012842639.1 PREDICTED: uncharacterized protein LOC105962851 [Erythranthe guttata]